jgi:hypothetical protein
MTANSVLLVGGNNAETRQRMADIIYLEMQPSSVLIYKFDLSTSEEEFKPIFLGVNLRFHVYHNGKPRILPVGAIVDWLRQHKQADYDALNNENPLTPNTKDVELATRLRDIGYIPAKKIIDTRTIREQIGYENRVTQFVADYAMFDKFGEEAIARIEHVLGRIDPVRIALEDPNITLLVGKMDQLLALSRLVRVRDFVVEVTKVSSIDSAACVRLSRGMAANLVASGCKIVRISSANRISHACYLTAYLDNYKVGLMGRTASDRTSALVDVATYNIWLDRYRKNDNQTEVDIKSPLTMTYFIDDAAVGGFGADEDFGTYFKNVRSHLEVYCPVTEGVAVLIDAFITRGGEKHGSNWGRRVLVIKNPVEYRDMFPQKRIRLIPEEDLEDD